MKITNSSTRLAAAQSPPNEFDTKELKNYIRDCFNEISNVKTQIERVESFIDQLRGSRSLGIDRTEELLASIEFEIHSLLQSNSDHDYTSSSLSTFSNIEQKLYHLDKAFESFANVNDFKSKNDDLIEKLKQEIKQLKESNMEFSLLEKNSSDNQLIQHLSSKLSRTLALNTTLNQQLKTAQMEVDSLKKLMLVCRNNPNSQAHPFEAMLNGLKTSQMNNGDKTNGVDEEIDDYEMNYDADDNHTDDGDDDDESGERQDEVIAMGNTMTNGHKRKNSSEQDYELDQKNPSQYFNFSLSSTVTNVPAFIDTNDLIARMKEFMTRYKISQQEIGRRVLGVKKSHAGYMLTHIRPWQELTRKGKEPYIRMYYFLEDEENYKKFFNGTYQIPLVDSSIIANESPNKPRPTKNSRMSLPPMQFHASQHFSKPLLTSALSQSFNVNNNSNNINNMSQDDFYEDSKDDLSKCDVIQYDISTITESREFDTNGIVEELKDALRAMKVSQELFCRAVLNLSDRILSRPRPWNALGKRAREHFLRIYMFLQDPFKAEKLHEWKTKNDFDRLRRKRIKLQPNNDSDLQEFNEFNQKIAENGANGDDGGDGDETCVIVNNNTYDQEIIDYEEIQD